MNEPKVLCHCKTCEDTQRIGPHFNREVCPHCTRKALFAKIEALEAECHRLAYGQEPYDEPIRRTYVDDLIQRSERAEGMVAALRHALINACVAIEGFPVIGGDEENASEIEAVAAQVIKSSEGFALRHDARVRREALEEAAARAADFSTEDAYEIAIAIRALATEPAP